ncbi:aprataxin and PNK-like factor [Protopterus annectens]|uniref:aprataxin and PNK-like factor n=1 Tax=Protopterus annectens TaxID=7888 RepID=UPI001CFBFCBE|nr:aprataxin and PNK-like factor [Protopterus annectens]
MPTFALQPVNGDSNIDLPDGETLIGRGPCFGISDKRVSRNHALLNVSSDGLRIKPTHINPCFYQPSDKDEQQVLEKDKWYPLYKGDIFSLLPDKYIFRVISTDSDSDTDATLNNSQILDEQLLDEDPAPSSSVPLTVDKSPGCSSVSSIDQKTAPADQRNANNDKRNASNQTFQPFETEDNDKKDQQRLPERKRVLPAWMLQGDLGNQSPSKSHNKGNERAGRGKTKGNAEESKPGVSQQKRRQWSSSDSGEEDEEIQQQIKKSRTSKSKTKGSSLKSEEKEDDNAVEAKGKSVIQNQRKNEKSQSEGKDEFLLNNKEPENKEAVNKSQQPDEKSNWQISDNEEKEATPTVSHHQH